MCVSICIYPTMLLLGLSFDSFSFFFLFYSYIYIYFCGKYKLLVIVIIIFFFFFFFVLLQRTPRTGEKEKAKNSRLFYRDGNKLAFSSFSFFVFFCFIVVHKQQYDIVKKTVVHHLHHEIFIFSFFS